MENYEITDTEVKACLAKIEEDYAELGNRKIAFSEVDLITHDLEGNRLVRIAETNLGNLCSDAFRIVTGADIGYINGGGLRTDLKAGEITFNDILNVFPFNNQAVAANVAVSFVFESIDDIVIYYYNIDIIML